MAEQPEELTQEQVARIEKTYLEGIEEVDKEDAQHVIAKEGKIKTKAQTLLEQPGRLLQLGRQILLLYDMLRDWWSGNHTLPWKTAAAVIAALLYFVNPFDLVPDFVPLIGYLDDAVVVGACFRLIRADLRGYAQAKSIDLGRHGL